MRVPNNAQHTFEHAIGLINEEVNPNDVCASIAIANESCSDLVGRPVHVSPQGKQLIELSPVTGDPYSSITTHPTGKYAYVPGLFTAFVDAEDGVRNPQVGHSVTGPQILLQNMFCPDNYFLVPLPSHPLEITDVIVAAAEEEAVEDLEVCLYADRLDMERLCGIVKGTSFRDDISIGIISTMLTHIANPIDHAKSFYGDVLRIADINHEGDDSPNYVGVLTNATEVPVSPSDRFTIAPTPMEELNRLAICNQQTAITTIFISDDVGVYGT